MMTTVIEVCLGLICGVFAPLGVLWLTERVHAIINDKTGGML